MVRIIPEQNSGFNSKYHRVEHSKFCQTLKNQRKWKISLVQLVYSSFLERLRSGYLKKPNRSLQSSQSKKNPYKRGRKIRKSFQQQNIEKKNICLLRVSFKKNFWKELVWHICIHFFLGSEKLGVGIFSPKK